MSKSRYVTSNIVIWSCVCKRCDNKFESKRINRPSCCPRCKSKKWEEPKSPLDGVLKECKTVPGHKYGRDSSEDYWRKFLGTRTE